jgi:hypothetical protein
LQAPALQAAEGGGAQNLIINVIGLLVFGGLFYADQSAGEARVEQRRQLRQAQIRSGDREVVLDDHGQKVSRLKEVREHLYTKQQCSITPDNSTAPSFNDAT